MRTIRCTVGGGALAELLVASVLWGAPAPGAPATGWHTVRPGETLEGITARYLGQPALWRRIAQLNPEIVDPDLLTPGQRIRIYQPPNAGPAAQVARLSRKVEAQPSPIPWTDARVGDLLLERDGVRTYAKSSAEMAFPDGTRLTVTEDSLVFLQRNGGALRGVERKSVEIVEGQADVEAHAAPRPLPAEVEIVLGSALATARTNPVGAVQTRARRSGGGAALMAYRGDAALEAAGAKVAVPQGMGTSAAPSGPPAPPEKLLPAVVALSPAEGTAAACANAAFSWQAVPGAASYVVEVCRDEGCGALVERQTGLTATEWRPQSLPAEVLFWRVTAQSASGLDGYPGKAVRLTVSSDRADTQAPTGALTLNGPQVRVGETLFAAPGLRIEGSVADAGSGPAEWLPVMNGRLVATAAAAGPWAAGAYQVGAVVADRCGNRATVPPVAFTIDATPPAITWEVLPFRGFEGRHRRRRQAGREPLLWSGGARWLPLREGEEVRIASDAPQALFRLPGIRVTAEGHEVLLGEGDMLRLAAADAESSVDHLRFVLRREEGGRAVLAIEAEDLVGNEVERSWEMRLPY